MGNEEREFMWLSVWNEWPAVKIIRFGFSITAWSNEALSSLASFTAMASRINQSISQLITAFISGWETHRPISWHRKTGRRQTDRNIDFQQLFYFKFVTWICCSRCSNNNTIICFASEQWALKVRLLVAGTAKHWRAVVLRTTSALRSWRHSSRKPSTSRKTRTANTMRSTYCRFIIIITVFISDAIILLYILRKRELILLSFSTFADIFLVFLLLPPSSSMLLPRYLVKCQKHLQADGLSLF